MDDQVVSGSDINWASSERPTVAALCAAVGAAAGYVAGMQGLLWYFGQPLTPDREIPDWIYHLIRAYGVVPPVPGGWVPAALAVGLGIACGVVGWRLATRSNVRHVRGTQIVTDAKEVAANFRPFQGDLEGVSVHPRVQIGEHAECRHMLLLGGAGSGKTTILRRILREIVARGDHVLLLDFKGDFTSGLECPITILSPTDARSARWALGRDIRTKLDAHALAETLIPLPTGGEPIWARGARGLLVGLIVHLQAKHKTEWGFAHIAELASHVLTNYKMLVEIVKKNHPPAKAYLMGADSKTTQSFLAELSGALTHVIELGVADHAALKECGRWSVRGWLSPKSKLPKVTVVGWRASSKELSQAWAASITEQIVRQIGDMEDCNPNERRVWLILDEVAQMGKVPSITAALVTLRSKGTRVVAGVQSVAQIREDYGPNALTTWAGSMSSKIICQLSSPEDQKFGVSLLGDREVERYNLQTTQANGVVSRSGSWQRAREPVMLPSDLGSELGPGFRGVKALVVTGNRKVALLRWPFLITRKVRKARVLAPWVGPKYVRPVWGESPPPVADVPNDEAARKAPLFTDANDSTETETEGVAQQIAIDAGVLAACPDCGVVYRQADADPASAYKLANAGFSRKLYPEFPDRRTLTDAVKAGIDGAPAACGCGVKPAAQDAQKKAAQEREQVPDRSKGAATKKPQQMQPSTPTAQAKAPKEMQPEADPFGDIVSGVLGDMILPGSSVIIGVGSAAGDATQSAPGAAPPSPGIPEPEPEPEPGPGPGTETDDREPEPGD